MATLHRLTTETLNLMRLVAEDQSEDRLTYRNELRRLSAPGLTMAFSEYEHFLEYYGYWALDSRLDSFTLSAMGVSATKGDEGRVKSLDEDVRHHFAKEIDQGSSERSFNASGHRFDQHYIRFEGVGRGGVGSVWRGEHLKTGRPVAIKTLEGLDEVMVVGRKSTLKKKIERVMRSVAQLSHPFITPILDLSVHHAPPYYVMPLCSGGSLKDLIAQGPISPELGLNLFAQICLGLAHAHESGVLHLDLKPENILIDKAGNAQIFDFGLSRVVAKQVAQAGRQSYVGFGSVAYMPPELLRDPLMEAPTIDIYALGLILYEILVGELPGRRSPMPSEVIKDLPLPIDDLFDMMVQDLPQNRPQSMGEVLAVLNKVEPFNRLSQKSMVLIFDHVPSHVTLPGLKFLELPNPGPELSEASSAVSAEVNIDPPRPEPSSAPSLAPNSESSPASLSRPSPLVPRLDATRRFEERTKSAVPRESTTRVVSSEAVSRLSLSEPRQQPEVAGGERVTAQSASRDGERMTATPTPTPTPVSTQTGLSGSVSHLGHATPVLSRAALEGQGEQELDESLTDQPTAADLERPTPQPSVITPDAEVPLSSAEQPLTARDRLSTFGASSSLSEEVPEVLEELIEELDDFEEEEATALHDQPSALSDAAIRPPALSSVASAGQGSGRATSPIQERLAKKYGPRSN